MTNKFLLSDNEMWLINYLRGEHSKRHGRPYTVIVQHPGGIATWRIFRGEPIRKSKNNDKDKGG